MRRIACAFIGGIPAVTLAVGLTFATYAIHPTPGAGVAQCVHSDYNDGSQDVCYTTNVQTGERVYIDVNDEVVPAP